MKIYIKPTAETVLFDGERYMLEGEVLNKASINDTDSGDTEIIGITPGNPGGGTDNWGGDAKEWNGWD